MDKRNLKKQINYICNNLEDECIFASAWMEEVDQKKMNEIINKIAELKVNSLDKCTFHFDKSPKAFPTKHEYNKARKAYFKKAYESLVAGFNREVDVIIKDMNDAVSKKA